MCGTFRGDAMPAPSPPAKRRAGALVGPLFFWDVVRLARRGRGTALRIVYGAGLLIALGAVYAAHFGTRNLVTFSTESNWVSIAAQADFAGAFAHTLMLAQNVAVLALVPAYLGGAIAEEKEKKTLDLLFTTELSDREIVLGKMLGRLLHVGGVLLAALPVLALAQLWGGVDVTVLVANFVVTGLTVLSVGGVCMVCSALTKTTLSALVLSYGASLLGVSCVCPIGPFTFSPLTFPFILDAHIGHEGNRSSVQVAAALVCSYAVVHGAIGVFAVGFAVAVLRPSEPRKPRPQPWLLLEVVPAPRPIPVLLPEVDGIYRPSPPVGDDALFWKEVLHRTGEAPFRWPQELALPALLVVILAGGAWVCVGLMSLDPRSVPAAKTVPELARGLNVVLRLGEIMLLTMACVAIGFRTAASVVRERARGTLEGLLTLPMSRETVLRAKWLGGVLRTRYLLYLVAAAWSIGICTGALDPLAFPLIVYTVAAQLTFVACLGVWLSVTATTVVRAHVSLAFLLLIFFVGGWLLWLWADPPTARHLSSGVFGPFLIGLTPWRAWWTLTRPMLGPEAGAGGRGVGLLPLVASLYFLAGAVLWWSAVRRFNKERGQVVAPPGKAP